MLARWWRPLGWLISKAHGARGTVALRRSRWPRNIVDARKEFPPDLFLRNPQNEQDINAKDKISMSKTGPSIFFSLLTTNFTRYGIVPRCRALILSSWWWAQIASMIDWMLGKRLMISNIKSNVRDSDFMGTPRSTYGFLVLKVKAGVSVWSYRLMSRTALLAQQESLRRFSDC